ncbi:DeoR/GlpR transcriptional regulator (plasmid) [Rhizobium rhizogenes]|uniref:Transcriptional regulator of the operon(S) for agrocinopine uptake and catabolism n=1 Tax=Agrobacterium tumefaciens TaxID=358 RepID=K7WT30_AGRTU|nr:MULTISPECIES: DeoR/GlpR family DNA-binding transcription regulator [Rhizobium/Agrobacterium group]AFX65637.1 Transcriptional regulator of the operon(s) for agrocinopine uptake and catabolism [Agrobacterium radiobacter]NTI39024.1 DeoR/GlpR transcriptional regulator [Rhizobium rhizogenes]NTI85208.1 DeoR/GlpR transcriptional regulator [Rhizobium rhizogenes]NTJ27394.1 DeoR/GlpR transcriptional regulator [Rhizobium rhizogenes]QUE84816.1 DeoR/GlpR transcriptional regulator [Rhizobium rhizogenes]
MLTAAQERQGKIVEFLREEQFLAINTLTERFQISVATARRDLGELEEAGLLRRTHGGAVSINQVAQDKPNAARAVWNQPQKAAIAAAVAAMIVDGDTVLLDAGTTALEVAKKLGGRKSLTLISNGLDIIAELSRGEGQSIYSVGGEYTDTNRSFRGPLAEQFIRQFNVDKLILNAASIDVDRGLICTSTPVNASVARAMIEVSRRVIVVADHSKFTKSSLSVTSKIEDVGVIVTDVGAKTIIDTAPEKLRRKFVIAN